jgi:hypothetical protein
VDEEPPIIDLQSDEYFMGRDPLLDPLLIRAGLASQPVA